MTSPEPLDQYLTSFQWNKVKYRADKSIAELISLLQKVHTSPLPHPAPTILTDQQEINSIDNDVRSKYNQYNSIRTNLATLHHKQSGNLSTKSLLSIVNPKILVQTSGSEHLETHLVAVPSSNVKDFNRSYETISPMVVPRSAYFVDSDSEYNLYAVTVFKKHAQEFIHKARESKWVPRDFKAQEGGKEEEVKELRKTEAEEKRVWGEILRLCRTGWSEGVMALVHVVLLRIFVETVLRYGLPLDYVGAVVKVSLLLCLRLDCGTDLTCRNRRTGNAPKKLAKPWTRPTHISAAMRLAETPKAECRRKTRRWEGQTWVPASKAGSTAPTCAARSTLNDS